MYHQEPILLMHPISQEGCFKIPRRRRHASLLDSDIPQMNLPNLSTINYSEQLPSLGGDSMVHSTRVTRKTAFKKSTIHKFEKSLPPKQSGSTQKMQVNRIKNVQLSKKSTKEHKQLKTLKILKEDDGQTKDRLSFSPKEFAEKRYQFKERLGQGSFGTVFKGYDHFKQQYIAIKVIKADPKSQEMAQFQINLLVSIRENDSKDQKSIVRIKDFFRYRGRMCIVSELLSVNLCEMLQTLDFKGICLDAIRKISIQIFTGLAFLKSLKIIHGDIKPQNIVLKEFNKTGVKIIDFGTSSYSYGQHYDYLMSRYYRAPQVILGYPYDQKIDMWSVGCVLAELYTGRPLFPGDNESEQIGYFAETLGLPSAEMLQISARSAKYFSDDGNIKSNVLIQGNRVQVNRRNLKSQINDSDFEHFLRKLLTWSPNDRLAPEDALIDPWVVEGFPKELLQEHIRNTKRVKQSICHPQARTFRVHKRRGSQLMN